MSTEAEKIRDDLLQESFAIRRSLELAIGGDGSASTGISGDCLKTIENFHHSLQQLSDRLSPAYIEDSLPLAIQGVVEPWRTGNPRLKINMDLPAWWSHEPPERSLVILKILDELLRITSSELLTDILINISLTLLGNIGELSVHISYPDTSTFDANSNQKELEYLSLTFEFLTSGQCCRRNKELTAAWYFRWFRQKYQFQG